MAEVRAILYNDCMKIIFSANTLYDQLKTVLREKGVLIEIPETDHLYNGIRNHADLHVHPIGDTLYISQEIEPYIGPHLLKLGVPCIVMKQALGTKYPNTVPLNAVSTNTFFIHNLDYSDKELLDSADEINLQVINIKQGYGRCTLLPLTDSTFLTSDRGIFNILTSEDLQTNENIDLHLIKNGPVILPGQPCGFFPGACGVVGRDLYVNGDLDTHPDCIFIRKLSNTLDLKILDVPGEPLRDVGSILTYTLPSLEERTQ